MLSDPCSELRLQRRELGERRVRIGLLLRRAATAALAALDVFRAQFGIAIGTVAARRTAVAAIAMRTAAAAIVALRTSGLRSDAAGARCGRDDRRRSRALAIVAAPPRLRRVRRRRALGRRSSDTFGRRSGDALGRGRHAVGGRRGLRSAARPARLAARPRLALRVTLAVALRARAARTLALRDGPAARPRSSPAPPAQRQLPRPALRDGSDGAPASAGTSIGADGASGAVAISGAAATGSAGSATATVSGGAAASVGFVRRRGVGRDVRDNRRDVHRGGIGHRRFGAPPRPAPRQPSSLGRCLGGAARLRSPACRRRASRHGNRLRRRLRPLLHAIAERAQHRRKIVAGAAGERRHRGRHHEAEAVGGGRRPRTGRARTPGQRRADEVGEPLEDVDAHRALAADAEAGDAIEIVRDGLVG